MGFSQNKFCRVWKVEDKGNYSVAQISTSKKNKETDQYETDWQNNFVRLVGKAHNQIKNMSIGDKGASVKIASCDVTNKYDKEKNTTYTNYVIFEFEEDGASSNKSSKPAKSDNEFMNVPDNVEDLPFD